MLFRPSIKTKFRTAAFGAGLVTLAAVSAFPAAAQQINRVNFQTPDCSTITDIGKRAICKTVRHTDEMKQETKALDARASAAEQELACTNLIVSDIEKNGEKTANLAAMPPKGQACKIARDLKLISG